MPLYHITHRDSANREIVATEDPIEAPDKQSAIVVFMGLMLGKSGEEIAASPREHLAYDYNFWIRSLGNRAEGALFERLGAIEAEAIDDPLDSVLP